MVIAFRSRFGPTNLMFLLRIKSRARRDALMRRAVRESWTVTQLERSIQALRGGRRPFVGRQPAVPTDRAEKLIALDALASKWLRWVEVAMPDLPDELQPVLTKTAKAVREVQRTLAELQEVVDTLQK
jgi:hypothetical protein